MMITNTYGAQFLFASISGWLCLNSSFRHCRRLSLDSGSSSIISCLPNSFFYFAFCTIVQYDDQQISLFSVAILTLFRYAVCRTSTSIRYSNASSFSSYSVSDFHSININYRQWFFRHWKFCVVFSNSFFSILHALAQWSHCGCMKIGVQQENPLALLLFIEYTYSLLIKFLNSIILIAIKKPLTLCVH